MTFIGLDRASSRAAVPVKQRSDAEEADVQ